MAEPAVRLVLYVILRNAEHSSPGIENGLICAGVATNINGAGLNGLRFQTTAHEVSTSAHIGSATWPGHFDLTDNLRTHDIYKG